MEALVVAIVWVITGLRSAYFHRDAWGIGIIGGFLLGPFGVLRELYIHLRYRR